MKHSTFSAQVANNLLTVLQGYSKTIRLLLVMFLTLTVTTNAWGADVTFATSAYSGKGGASGTGGNATATIDGVTITSTKAYYTSAHIREYSGGTITVSSSSNITKIVFTSTSSGTNSNGPGKISLNSGGGSYFYDGTVGTWTGSGSSTSIKFDCDAQFRWTNIVVTIASSHTVTWTINPAAGDTLSATSGNSTTVTPDAAYTYGSPAYTVTSGSASVSQNGNTFTATPTANSTIQINMVEKSKCTVTLNAGPGTCAASVTEASAGAGVTLPTPTLDCGDWEFAGWKTTSAVTTETTTEPTLIPAGAYSPTSDITLYAVYQRTVTTSGGGGGGVATGTISFASTAQRTSFSTDTQVWVNEGITFTNNKGSGSNVADYSNPIRLYKNSEIVISAPDNIDQIVFTASSSSYATDLATSVGNEAECSSSTVTVTPATDATSYTITLSAGQTRLNSLTVTYTSGGGGGSSSTTYYHSTPDCGVASTPTLTVDKTSLVFGNVATDSNKEMDFTLTGSNLTANATLALSGADASKFSVSPTSVTQSDGTINQTDITVTYTPTAAGEHTATLTISSTGAESKTVALSGTGTAPAAKYTVTFDAGSGTCDDESLTETSGGAGVTLPTANPPATCATDGWTFAGWWTGSVAETTTSPGELLTAGSNYKPASDCTLYAVYSHTEAGGGGSGFYLSVTKDATTYYIGEKGSGSYLSAVTDVNSAATFNIENNKYLYYGNKTYVSSISDNTSLTIATTTPSATWAITDEGETITFKSNGTGGRYLAFNYNSGSPRFSSYGSTYTYELTKHTTSTTTYNSNPVCVASWSITYNFAGGTGSHCSNTSVPQGDPYTICDEAPTKEGHTFQGWSDGTDTYEAGETITPTDHVILTAQWQINTYTVTWSVNGATTEVTYEHGQALSEKQPADPTSAACDGEKEFVGWTANDEFTYNATTPPSDLFKTTTATVTADKTYYAVFATKGAGGTEFVLGESGTFKMYANVNGTNYYAQGGVSSSQITSTTNALSASDYTLTYAEGSYTIQQGTSNIGHTSTNTNLSNNATEWIISAGSNGSWRVQSSHDESRALSYSSSANAFKAYATSNITAGDDTYFDIEFGTGSSGYSDYTTTCQQVESIEVQNPQTEFYLTDDFTIGSGKVIATLSGGGTTDVTALAHFSGYNMEATGTQTVTVTYMGSTATYEITVKPLDNAWVLTWNVSGKTNTGLGPRSVTKGNAIGTLPVPEVPAACAGKTFMGWTESNIVPSDGKGIVYITEATVPTKNTTYYAVFATINNFSTQAAIEDIKSGSKVVIVAVASMDASGGAGQAISSRTISITSKGVIGLSGDEVSIFDETINTPHSTCIWTLTKEGGGIVFEQGGKYIRAVDGGYRRLLLETTKDYWTLSPVTGKDKTYHMQSGNTSHYVEWFDHTDSKYDEGERYIGFVPYTEANDNGDFDMQFYVTANDNGEADITDYTTGCAEYTITYYGFHGGYSTSCSSDGTIVLPVNSLHTVPNCGDVVTDHTNLGREFLNVWMTQPHGGHTFKPGDTFILTQDTTLYAQWKMETTSDVTTLPTDIEDLAGTDIYVYGGTTLNIQPGTTTINSLTLKGGIQEDGSYKMPTVWVPEGATLVRNSNKIYLDLKVNAKNYYPFAVPFATKNDQYIDYLDPVLNAASTYDDHFVIKTYDGARRATQGEDRANNWVKVLRHQSAEKPSYLQPGVGYIITALTRPDKDTATIRIPMTVPNTWFQNGEQAAVSTTVRNTIAVTAHGGTAANEHQRHAGWNFVANPYLTSFAGGNVANDGGLDYINGELIIQGSYVYGGDPVPYVTVPAYDFAYYSQHKLSDVKLSPEWSFFVQVGTGGTMNFTTAGRQQAPASIAARNAEERPVKMDVDLILSDNHSSDQTGIIICDRYSDAYEIGRDLEKLFGSAYNLSVYTLMEDNTPLAFQALAIRSSMQVIPVGYRAPEQGEYTFRLNEATSSIDLLNEQYEQLVLVDYQTGELTNLLYTDYTFYSERTQSNSRFAIYAVPRQNAPTDLPNAIGSDEEVRKVIYNDRLYILRDGNVYNGMGQKM